VTGVIIDPPVAPNGATLASNYIENSQDVVGVPVREIQDSMESAKEEVWQFLAGGFLFSGAFWLGFERIVTEGYKDALFLSCIPCVICGAILAITGYRQAMRRVNKLRSFIPDNADT